MVKQMLRRHMILLVAIVIATIFTIGSVIAATNRTPAAGKCKMNHAKMSQKAVKQLNLTPAQQDQIKAILNEQKVKLQNIKQSKLSPAEKRVQKQKLFKETKDRIAPILTPEQQKKAKQMLAQHRKQMAKKCINKLNLTPDQQAKLTTIKSDARNAIKNIKADRKLSQQAKKDQIKLVRKQAHEDFMSILTPEQRAKIPAGCCKMQLKAKTGR